MFRRELLDFMVQEKINRGRYTNHPAGCYSIWTNQYLHHPPFFTGRMPFLPPNLSVKALKALKVIILLPIY